MLEMFVVRETVFFLTGVMIGIGVIARLITGISLKRLVKAASNMSKSNHPLMRLVRAKFEHGCMVSDKVQNVDAFVEKYLYEYRVLGVRLHTWRQWTKGSIWLCLLFGMIGTALAYAAGEREQGLYRYGILGGTGAVALFLLRMMADDSYQITAAKTYMVDFLENTYAHRYAKTNQKEFQVTVQRANEEPNRKEEAVPASAAPVNEEYFTGNMSSERGEYVAENGISEREKYFTENTDNTKRSGFQKLMRPKQESVQDSGQQEQDEPFRQVASGDISESVRFQQDNGGEKLEPTKEARIREILEEFLA